MMTLSQPTSLSSADEALLRRFEPVLCFNLGEQFYPMDVDRYLARARLCAQRPGREAETLVARGRLDGAMLGQIEPRDDDMVYFLSVADPLSVTELRAFRHHSTLREFRVGMGRLVRVGLPARLFDVLFSLSLLLRGKAPGSLAMGSAQGYHAMQAEGERYVYYGRVLREHGWIALQYWYFYAFNDWRASFHGVNDHEADWELVTIYAAEDARGEVRPYWLAYSAHDSDGDDLRRRCDDPDLDWVGEHPVVYAAAGSHANYFFQGEYMPSVPVPYTQDLARIWLAVRRFWARIGQGNEPDASGGQGFRIPFVDYARGDGLRIGPGQAHSWEPRLLQDSPTAPAPAWVAGYAGLWGFYSGDPRGENAPPGPMYERDGSQRRRWYDPVGWSGLDKLPPPAEEVRVLLEQEQRLRAEHDALNEQIAEQAARLAGLHMEAEAVGGGTSRLARHMGLPLRLRDVTRELEGLKANRSANEQTRACALDYARRLETGNPGDPRAHLRHPALPTTVEDLRLSRVAAIWSALSIGLLLIGCVALAQFSVHWAPGAIALIGAYATIDAIFHRNIEIWLARVVVALAIVTVLVLAIQFFRPLAFVTIVLVGLFIMVDNVREVFS